MPESEHAFRDISNSIRSIILKSLKIMLCPLCPPEEGVLPPVHPGSESQTWILSERRDDQSERQRQENKTGWQHNLPQAETNNVTLR